MAPAPTSLTDESLPAGESRFLLDCLAGRAEPVVIPAHSTDVHRVKSADLTAIGAGRAGHTATMFTPPPA